MTNIIVQEGQSIFDIVIQHYGSIDFLVQFCFDNKIGIDTDLTAGQVVVVDETIGVKSVKEFFKLNALSANNRQWKEEVVLSDLDILRQIRDANPTSQLNTLFDDSKNPHSEWWNGYNGAVFGDSPYFNSAFESIGATPIPVNDRIANRCYIFAWWDALDLRYVPNLNNLTKLIYLNLNYNLIENINITGLINLEYLDLYSNKIGSINLLNCTKLKKLWLSECGLNNIDVTGLQELELFNVDGNLLSSIISLTSKGNIIEYDFKYNNLPTAELNRLRALGFTDESKLLPQNP